MVYIDEVVNCEYEAKPRRNVTEQRKLYVEPKKKRRKV